MTYKSNVVPKSANIRGVQMVVFNLARFNGVHLIEYHSYLNFILVEPPLVRPRTPSGTSAVSAYTSTNQTILQAT